MAKLELRQPIRRKLNKHIGKMTETCGIPVSVSKRKKRREGS
jgi:hypothetical protein